MKRLELRTLHFIKKRRRDDDDGEDDNDEKLSQLLNTSATLKRKIEADEFKVN